MLGIPEFLKPMQRSRFWNRNKSSNIFLDSLGGGARALAVLGGRRGGGVEESSLWAAVTGGRARVDGRRPLVQRRVLFFMRNVAEAVQRRAALRHGPRGRALALRTGERSLWGGWASGGVRFCVFGRFTPNVSGRSPCGMLGIFGTAAGSPLWFGLTVEQKQFQRLDRTQTEE